MKSAIKEVSEGRDISLEEAKRVMNIMLSGEATQAQIATYLTALRMKGESIDEIVGSAIMLGEKADHIHPKAEVYVDFVGTGGDGVHSFNVSTTSAFVCAGAGLTVAKHGNRAISSKSGAGDVLEALGINIITEASKVEQAVNEVGIGFMFAQTFNKSMKYVGQARSEMGIRTIFNVIGPMSNPSGAKKVLIGVYAKELTAPIAKALGKMGVENALIVCGLNGMDEITVTDATQISELRDGVVKTYEICPEDFGMQRAEEATILGGDSIVNAGITRAILAGEDRGPKRDTVLLNAGAALYVAGFAKDIQEGIKLAEDSIDSGKAMKKLEALIEFTNK